MVEVAADTNGSPWTAIGNSTTVADGAHTVVAGGRRGRQRSHLGQRQLHRQQLRPRHGQANRGGHESSGRGHRGRHRQLDLAANASDASGLTKVEWWVDGVRVATDTDGAPWTKPWNSATVADGAHKIIAKARDTAGNWGASLSVNFSVSQTAPPPDTTAPTVSVTAPAAAA